MNHTLVRSMQRVLGCVAGLTLAASAAAIPPQIDFYFAVNDGDEKHDFVNGTSLPNGNQVYIQSYTAVDGSWVITYNVTVDYTTNPQTSVVGIVTVENKDPRESQSFRVGVDVPVCPMIKGGSLVGGSAVLTFTTVGAGTLSCNKNGEPIFNGMADLHPIGAIFFCPTTLTSTGSSTISYSGTFGLPGPSLAGPEIIGTVGMREQFVITPKDKLSMQFSMFFKDADGVPPPGACETDVDGDGEVGPADLAAVFSDWGDTDTCPAMLEADFNADGIVNAADLMILLNAWGDCDRGSLDS